MRGNPAVPKIQYLKVNGVSLAFQDWPGERGPLICVPSITGHKGSFAALAGRLSPEFRTLAIDLRGRCDSSKPKDGYGFSYHARDIVAIADALHLPTFSLVGHSFGATASAYIASVRPDRVKSLVLMDGGADPRTDILRGMYETVRRLTKVYASMNEYLEFQRSMLYHKPWTPTLERYLKEDVEATNDGSVRSKSSADAIQHDLDIHFYYSMCLHFPTLRCPVLFLRPLQGLAGNSGHLFSNAEAANIVRQIPNCRRADVPGGNHYTMLIQDDPPVVPFILEFLDHVMKKPAAIQP